MSSRLILGSLTMLLLPAGMAMAQGHGGHGGHGGGGHVSAGGAHWSGHPGGNWGGAHAFGGSAHWSGHNMPYAYHAYHNGGYGWNSNFNRWHGGNWGGRYGYRYPYYRYGHGFYPYGFYGYPYASYGYWPYYSSWYPYSSWYSYSSLYPYDWSYAYSYPDYGYDYGLMPDYGSYPPADDGYSAAPSYSGITSSQITITAPPGAQIWVEGVKISAGDGTVHTFQTPPLNPDQQYRYRVRAVWTGADGRAVDQTQEVVFSAGAGVSIRFPTPQVSPVPQA